jgi:hypothetical protein
LYSPNRRKNADVEMRTPAIVFGSAEEIAIGSTLYIRNRARAGTLYGHRFGPEAVN